MLHEAQASSGNTLERWPGSLWPHQPLKTEARESCAHRADWWHHPPVVAKALVAVTLLIAVAALGVAIAAFREAHRANEPSTYADITAAAVSDFQAAGNRMTPAQVLRLLGEPDEVYRNTPRALCWRYGVPYTIKMCWGSRRQQAWIAHNIPREDSRA